MEGIVQSFLVDIVKARTDGFAPIEGSSSKSRASLSRRLTPWLVAPSQLRFRTTLVRLSCDCTIVVPDGESGQSAFAMASIGFKPAPKRAIDSRFARNSP
jgi:hypothetical protein